MRAGRYNAGVVRVVLLLCCLTGASQDPFVRGVVQVSELDERPRIVEKRVPFGSVNSGFHSVSGLRVEFIIERDGSVQYVRPVGDGGTIVQLNEIRILLQQWAFTPGKKGGVPVRTLATLATSAASWTVDGVMDDFGAGATRIGEPGLVAPRVKKDVKPVYPADLVSAGIDGSVEIEVVVQPSGRVARARVISSTSDRFERNALDCARRWQFEPGLRGGAAVPVLASIVLEFRFRNR